MWQYRQATGELSHDGEPVGVGYSGAGSAKNNPAKQDILMEGPIPRGRYRIGTPQDTAMHGPFAMRLIPYPENEMFERSAFLIHGDSIRAPGSASEGCLILNAVIRHQIAASQDQELEVVE